MLGGLKGTALIWREGDVVGMRKGGIFLAGGRDCGLSWKFYIQIPMAEHVEGFYTHASGQGEQLGVLQGDNSSSRWEVCIRLSLPSETSFTL